MLVIGRRDLSKSMATWSPSIATATGPRWRWLATPCSPETEARIARKMRTRHRLLRQFGAVERRVRSDLRRHRIFRAVALGPGALARHGLRQPDQGEALGRNAGCLPLLNGESSCETATTFVASPPPRRVGVSGWAAAKARAEDTIKIGILHSLSGTMAISETILQGPDADAGRRAQRERRPARQEDRAGRRRSRVELAAVRGKGARADQQGQSRGGVRLLDLGLAQIRAAGVRGTERTAVLPARI